MNENTVPQNDRRKHLMAREVFPEACALFAPLLLESGDGLSMTRFSMIHVLREHFSRLPPQEASILAAAIEHLHRDGRLLSSSLPVETAVCPSKDGLM